MGRNRPFGNEVAKDKARSIHAEIDALSKKRADLDDAIAYIVVLTKGRKNDGLSRPCASCLMALRDQGIAKIAYSNRGAIVVEKLV
jgi:deoxycytidylate deaminase